MPLLLSRFNIYARFLSRLTPLNNSLDRIASDVIVDVIFNYLDVIDIIRMRMVRPSFELRSAEMVMHGWDWAHRCYLGMLESYLSMGCSFTRV